MNRLKSKLKAMLLMVLFSAGVLAADTVTLDKATWPTNKSAEFKLVETKAGETRKVSLPKEVAVDNDFVLEGTFSPAEAGQDRSVKVSVTPINGGLALGDKIATTTNAGVWTVTIPKNKLVAAEEYEVTVVFRNRTNDPVQLTKKHYIVVGGNQDPGPGPGPIIVTPPVMLPPQ